MSRMIKLSKSDWLRIGREQGYIKSSQTLGRESPLLQLGMAVIDAAEKMKGLDELNAIGFKAGEEMNAKIKSVTKGLQEIVRELPPDQLSIRVHRAAEMLLHELNGIIVVMRLYREGGQEGYKRIKRRLRTALDHEEELMKAAEAVRVREEFESGMNLARDFCSTTDDNRQRIPAQLEQIQNQLEQIRKNVLERSAPQRANPSEPAPHVDDKALGLFY